MLVLQTFPHIFKLLMKPKVLRNRRTWMFQEQFCSFWSKYPVQMFEFLLLKKKNVDWITRDQITEWISADLLTLIQCLQLSTLRMSSEQQQTSLSSSSSFFEIVFLILLSLHPRSPSVLHLWFHAEEDKDLFSLPHPPVIMLTQQKLFFVKSLPWSHICLSVSLSSRAGYLPQGVPLQLIGYLPEETSFLPWHSASRALYQLDKLLDRTDEYRLFSVNEPSVSSSAHQ